MPKANLMSQIQYSIRHLLTVSACSAKDFSCSDNFQYIIYVNENCYLQAIKIPPNLKQVWRVLVKSFGHSNTAHQIAVFFNLVDVPTFSYIKRKADKL